ncbi:hypothetical protein ABEB36_013195 [Hypothenemus hampei]
MPPTSQNQQPSKKEEKEADKPKNEVTFKTHVTTLAHISVLIFVYVIIKLATNGDFEFFTWHPLLMAFGWMLLMTEGLLSINKYNTFWRQKTKGSFRVKVHFVTISGGYLLSTIGSAIVYINKEKLGKSHYQSWHALFGLIALISAIPPLINGLALWYNKELAIKKPKLVKFVHVLSGTSSFTFGALSLLLSVYTKWYKRKSNNSEFVFYLGFITLSFPVLWAIYGPSVKLFRVIKSYFSEEKAD